MYADEQSVEAPSLCTAPIAEKRVNPLSASNQHMSYAFYCQVRIAPPGETSNPMRRPSLRNCCAAYAMFAATTVMKGR